VRTEIDKILANGLSDCTAGIVEMTDVQEICKRNLTVPDICMDTVKLLINVY